MMVTLNHYKEPFLSFRTFHYTSDWMISSFPAGYPVQSVITAAPYHRPWLLTSELHSQHTLQFYYQRTQSNYITATIYINFHAIKGYETTETATAQTTTIKTKKKKKENNIIWRFKKCGRQCKTNRSLHALYGF